MKPDRTEWYKAQFAQRWLYTRTGGANPVGVRWGGKEKEGKREEPLAATSTLHLRPLFFSPLALLSLRASPFLFSRVLLPALCSPLAFLASFRWPFPGIYLELLPQRFQL